ncbi:hypothetical protein BT63DRAFT_443316 [Microthyrium microscopicum]|uniref:Helicase-associated domain-containing protein n=1 Tax=Microthyrium microscopicum TaxID=703497 RepID=A0A6A6U094_9PEZI|nr:hypothetical protein BT63DRAFT_443316 [Microthyrium microscopicum]
MYQDLKAHILLLHSMGFSTFLSFDWILKPEPELVLRNYRDLRDLNFIDDDYKLTQTGHFATNLPIQPIWSGAIFLATEQFNCGEDMADLAAIFSVQKSIFTSPQGFLAAASMAVLELGTHKSDHLFYLWVFQKYISITMASNENMDQIPTLDEVVRLRLRLERRLAELPGWEFHPRNPFGSEGSLNIRKALANAFHTQSAIHESLDVYRTVHDNCPALLHPICAQLNACHEWIVFGEFSQGWQEKQYLEIVTVIEPEWIMLLPYFQDDRLRKNDDGEFEMGKVKASLDAARGATSQEPASKRRRLLS